MAYTKPVCRGDFTLGTACGRCERCIERKPAAMSSTTNATTAELESKLRCVISHATGGSCDDISLSLNEIGVRITRHVNRVWESAQESALAKATPSPQIERAKEALEQIALLASNYGAWYENDAWEWGQSIGKEAEKALAALSDGGRSS